MKQARKLIIDITVSITIIITTTTNSATSLLTTTTIRLRNLVLVSYLEKYKFH
jgi:hypothetical protein